MQEDLRGGHPSHRRATPALRGGGVSFLRCIPGQLGFVKRWRGVAGLSCSLVSGFRCIFLWLVTQRLGQVLPFKAHFPRPVAVLRAAGYLGASATLHPFKYVPREGWVLAGEEGGFPSIPTSLLPMSPPFTDLRSGGEQSGFGCGVMCPGMDGQEKTFPGPRCCRLQTQGSGPMGLGELPHSQHQSVSLSCLLPH